MRPGAWRSLLLRGLFTFGVASLSYLLGAAVVHFKLPTADLLDDAFMGGHAWAERHRAAEAPIDFTVPAATVGVDRRDRTFEGYTAYTTDHGSHAVLLDMRGAVVHRWSKQFSEIWPKPAHIANPVADGHVYYFDCHLYPNGDLLTVSHGIGDTPYGYGLAKLDKDSKVIWTYSANAHHSVDVGEDGVIYVLTQKLVHTAPKSLEWFSVPFLADSLVLLSADGKEQKTISILEALRDSPYGALVAPPEMSLGPAWDVLHTNRVCVLTKALAPHFPRFKPGAVLISIRELDALAVIDTESGAVVWAARGPWRGQHDPQFLQSGRLLVFDNRGFGRESRVLEYDPATQACPWVYSSEDSPSFMSSIQGRAQRLANGNTLIVNSKDGDLYEVTPAREVVWSCACQAHVPWARRYRPSEVPFVHGDSHARP